MPDVMAAADIVLSRAGANSIWECSVLGKPMILVPLCGSGTRGDQEDNAGYFEGNNAAVVLSRENATAENLQKALELLIDEKNRRKYAEKSFSLSDGKMPAVKIAEILFSEIFN